jgi:hypothetical protein
MAYSAPNTFVNATPLTAADVEGNNEALRLYLHQVNAADLEASKWVDTRHIQPPDYLPYAGVIHGCTGYQGGQWGGGAEIRLTFATKYLTGNGQPDATSFHYLPNSAFQLDIRRAGTLVFHYWLEWEAGQDASTAGYQVTQNSRAVWVAPWIQRLDTAYSAYREYAQETRNAEYGIASAYPIGTTETYVQGGGYGQKQGTLTYESALGRLAFGLGIHSQIDRVGVVNWGCAVEYFYL